MQPVRRQICSHVKNRQTFTNAWRSGRLSALVSWFHGIFRVDAIPMDLMSMECCKARWPQDLRTLAKFPDSNGHDEYRFYGFETEHITQMDCMYMLHVHSCVFKYIYIVQGPLPKSSLFAVAQNRTRNDSRGTFHPESHHSWNVPFCTLINRVCDCRVSNNFKLCFGHDSPACFKCRAKHEPIAFGQPPFNQIGLTSSPALIILNLTSSTLQK